MSLIECIIGGIVTQVYLIMSIYGVYYTLTVGLGTSKVCLWVYRISIANVLVSSLLTLIFIFKGMGAFINILI